MLTNNSLNKLFSNNLNLTKMNQPTTSNPLTRIAIKHHTNDFMTGKYPCLHMNQDNEDTYVLGFLKGMEDAMNTWEQELDKLQEKYTAMSEQYNALISSSKLN